MWISRKRWDALEKRIEELERSTGMTAFSPEGWIGHWMRPALPINQVVEKLAEQSRLRYRKTCTEQWTTAEPEKK